MFIFLVQLADLFAYQTVQLFLVFFLVAWTLFLFRLRQSAKYTGIVKNPKPASISVIIPVVDEPLDIWAKVLESMSEAIKDLDAEVFVVPNGKYSKLNADMARNFGFNVIELEEASKRKAIVIAGLHATKDIVILLDSDTIVTKNAIKTLARGFVDNSIGGIVPRQESFYKNTIMEKLCNWYEDIRFFNTTRGLSYHGQIPCLIGRLFAIRRELLQKYLPAFDNQYLFGIKVETGDDRVLTNMLLQDGFKTLYEDTALVYTIVPQTIKKFAKQRTRWARSSFRETLLSLPWLPAYPVAITILVGDVIVRWLFFAVVVNLVWKILSGNLSPHYLNFTLGEFVIWGVIGFFVSGYIKQLPHLYRKPQDIFLTPLFLLLNTFVLTPVEWYGNLTFWKQNWLTRKIK